MKTRNGQQQQSKEKKEGNKGGRLIAFGGLHLMFTVTLPNDFFNDKEINFEQLEALKDIAFICECKELWDNVTVDTNNETMNLLMQMNKSTKKKVTVDYMSMGKIVYSEEQEKFKEFIATMSETCYIKVLESDVCDCNMDMILYVKWKEQLKSFGLCKSTHFATKEEKEEEEKKKKEEGDNTNKEKDKKECEGNNNTQEETKQKTEGETEEAQANNKEQVEPSAVKDEQENQPEENQENQQPIKTMDETREEGKKDNPFTKIEIPLDSYDYIYFNFLDYTKSELASSITLENLLSFLISLKQNSKIKIMINFFDSLPTSMTNEELQRLEYIMHITDVFFFNRKEAYNLFDAFHALNQGRRKLDKKKYLDVFFNIIAAKSPSGSKQKLGLFLDEFNKLQIAEANGSKNQGVIEYDAALYPKINHYNMNTVEEYKQLIIDNYLHYARLFVGTFIGKLIQDSINDESVYTAYLTAIESVKKIVELDKNKLEKPTDPSFYIVQLPKGSINQKIGQDMLHAKEKSFVLDCVNDKSSKLKYYNPLFDSHLNMFFSSKSTRKELETKGFINSKGFIMYDATYRDLLGGSQQRKRNVPVNQRQLLKTINNINVGEHLPNKEINSQEAVLKQASPLPKKLPVIPPTYSQYQRGKKLPPLKNGNRTSYEGRSNTTSNQQKGNVCKTEPTEKKKPIKNEEMENRIGETGTYETVEEEENKKKEMRYL